MRFPSVNDVASELRRINKSVESAPDGDDGGVDVRLQVYPDGQWAVSWGDSQYDQDHRGFWGSSSVPGDNRRFDSKDIARDLIEQAREQKATGGDEGLEEAPAREMRTNYRSGDPSSASSKTKEFTKFLDEAVILVAGNASAIIDPYAEEVHVAIVFNVTGYGPHVGAIYADQNRFHASADSALEGAHEILEEWEEAHYPGGDEHRTETFDGRTWTLPAAEFADAIYGRKAEEFIDVEGDDDEEPEDEEPEDDEGDDDEEPEDEEPEDDEEDDAFSDEAMYEGYVISDGRDGGYGVTHEGKSVGSYDDMDEALDAIDEHMKKSNFFPNIYYVNDHGNIDLLDGDGKVVDSRV